MAEQVVKAVKKKSWVQLVAPKMFNNLVLGETMVSEPEQLVGRIISVNLATITNDLRQQSINIKFKIISVEGTKAHTELIGCETSPSAIKRLVRRGATRIDESLVLETADKKKIMIKLFLVTKAIVRSSTAHAIRKALPEILQKEFSKTTFESLIKLLMANKLQMGLKSQIKKVYPLRSCEVKAIKIISESAKLAQKEEVQAEKAEVKKEVKEEKAEKSVQKKEPAVEKAEPEEQKKTNAEVKKEKAEQNAEKTEK